MTDTQIEYFGDVKNYLETARRMNPKDFKKLIVKIQKLKEHGYEVIKNGSEYKKIHTKTKHPIIQIKLSTKRYRLHCAFVLGKLWVLNGFDKKKSNGIDMARSETRLKQFLNA